MVKPFFRDHLARIDRQVVLVDALGAIGAGPAAFEDLRRTMAGILTAFRPGRNGFFRELLLGRRVERILFAATKADHLHHSQHARLTAIMTALVDDARRRADFAGRADRCHVDRRDPRHGRRDPRPSGGRSWIWSAAPCPTAARRRSTPANCPRIRCGCCRRRAKAPTTGPMATSAPWQFRPAVQGLKPGEGPPHIRLDRAAQFLIGDRL